MAAYKNTVLIFNPRAGRFGRKGGSLDRRAAEILTQSGHRVTVAPTTGPRTAGKIARGYIDEGADLVVVAGGDGTINEVAEGMVHTTVPLAILPGGTANVLASEMGIAGGLERVARTLDKYQARRISVGHLKCDGGRVSRHFLLMAGIGLDAHIVYNVNLEIKARTGKLAYWLAAASVLGRPLEQIQVELEGGRRECSFALLSKVRNYGGDFAIARGVSLFDDEFEAVFFEGRSPLPYLKYFLGVALNRLPGMKGVTVLRTDRVKLSCPEGRKVSVQIDGEYAGHLPAEVRIVRDALTLLVPGEYGQ